MTERREFIEAKVTDLVGELLYYGRKGDEDLPVGDIEEALKNGEVTEEEILSWFAKSLAKELRRPVR